MLTSKVCALLDLLNWRGECTSLCVCGGGGGGGGGYAMLCTRAYNVFLMCARTVRT